MWMPYNNGKTIGKPGSEDGVTLRDEEHTTGIRISLEKGGWQPYSITCGIYGSMVHTAFASSIEEAETKYSSMKQRLEFLVGVENEDAYREGIEKFVGEF